MVADCSITKEVMEDLQESADKGLVEYGVTLGRTDLTLREWLQHAYEETLDTAKYLKRAIRDLDDSSQTAPPNGGQLSLFGYGTPNH